MIARSESSVAKREGLEGGTMNKDANLSKRWITGRVGEIFLDAEGPTRSELAGAKALVPPRPWFRSSIFARSTFLANGNHRKFPLFSASWFVWQYIITHPGASAFDFMHTHSNSFKKIP
jgi:hypothetical protein